jgi:hypothetical protein
LLKCTIGLGEPVPRPLGRTCESGSITFSQMYPLLNFSPGETQLMKIASRMLRNTVNMIFGPLSYASLLSGPRRPIDIQFADDCNVTETMIRHWSRCHGSRPFAVVQASGVSVLRVRLAFAAAHWLVDRESNEVHNFKTTLFQQMNIDRRGRDLQGGSSRSH